MANLDRWYIAVTCALTALLSAGLALSASRWASVRNGTTACGSPTSPCWCRSSSPTGSRAPVLAYAPLNREVQDIADQIVWYNNDHNLQLRIFSMPVDDLFYGFLMIAMTVVAYELIARRLGLVTGSAPAPRP